MRIVYLVLFFCFISFFFSPLVLLLAEYGMWKTITTTSTTSFNAALGVLLYKMWFATELGLGNRATETNAFRKKGTNVYVTTTTTMIIRQKRNQNEMRGKKKHENSPCNQRASPYVAWRQCVKIMLYKLVAIGFELSKCAHAFAKSRCITTVFDAISELHGVLIGARRSIEANTMAD